MLAADYAADLDTAAVTRHVDRAARPVMMRAGAFVRRRAQSRLRRRKKPSAAGQAPSVHATDSRATLKNIRFDYDAEAKELIVGFVLLDTGNEVADPSGTLPETLEFGGTVSLLEEERRPGRWRRVNPRRPARDLPRRHRTVTYAARPVMGPALDDEKDQFAEMWEGAFAT